MASSTSVSRVSSSSTSSLPRDVPGSRVTHPIPDRVGSLGNSNSSTTRPSAYPLDSASLTTPMNVPRERQTYPESGSDLPEYLPSMITAVEPERPDFLFEGPSAIFPAPKPPEELYGSVNDGNLDLFHNQATNPAYFSIRQPATADKLFYGRWSPLVMRNVQEKFGLSLAHIKWLQQVLQSFNLSLDRRFSTEAITPQLAAKIQLVLLRCLVGSVLVPPRGTRPIPHFDKLEYLEQAAPDWPKFADFELFAHGFESPDIALLRQEQEVAENPILVNDEAPIVLLDSCPSPKLKEGEFDDQTRAFDVIRNFGIGDLLKAVGAEIKTEPVTEDLDNENSDRVGRETPKDEHRQSPVKKNKEPDADHETEWDQECDETDRRAVTNFGVCDVLKHAVPQEFHAGQTSLRLASEASKIVFQTSGIDRHRRKLAQEEIGIGQIVNKKGKEKEMECDKDAKRPKPLFGQNPEGKAGNHSSQTCASEELLSTTVGIRPLLATVMKHPDEPEGPPAPPKSIGTPKPIQKPRSVLDKLWNCLVSLPVAHNDAELCEMLAHGISDGLYHIWESQNTPEGCWLSVVIGGDQTHGPILGVTQVGAHVKLLASLYDLDRILPFFVRHKISWGSQAQHEPWGEIIYESVKNVLSGLFEFLEDHPEPRCYELEYILQEFQEKCSDFSMDIRLEYSIGGPWICTMHLHSAIVVVSGSSRYSAILEALKKAAELPFLDGPESIREKWRLVVGGFWLDQLDCHFGPEGDSELPLGPSACQPGRIDAVCRHTLQFLRFHGVESAWLGCDSTRTEVTNMLDGGKLFEVCVTLFHSKGVDSVFPSRTVVSATGPNPLFAFLQALVIHGRKYPIRAHPFLIQNLTARVLLLRAQTPWTKIVDVLAGFDTPPSMRLWLNELLAQKLAACGSKDQYQAWLDNPRLGEGLLYLYLSILRNKPRFRPERAAKFLAKLANIDDDDEVLNFSVLSGTLASNSNEEQIISSVFALTETGDLASDLPFSPQASHPEVSEEIIPEAQPLLEPTDQREIRLSDYQPPVVIAQIPSFEPPLFPSSPAPVRTPLSPPPHVAPFPHPPTSVPPPPLPIPKPPFGSTTAPHNMPGRCSKFVPIPVPPEAVLSPELRPVPLPESLGFPRRVMVHERKDSLWNKLTDLGNLSEQQFVSAIFHLPPQLLHVHELSSAIDLDSHSVIFKLEVSACEQPITVFGHSIPGVVVNLLLAGFPFDRALQLLARSRFSLLPLAKVEPWGPELMTKIKQSLSLLFKMLQTCRELVCERLPDVLANLFKALSEFSLAIWNDADYAYCEMYVHAISTGVAKRLNASAACRACLDALLADLDKTTLLDPHELENYRHILSDWISLEFQNLSGCNSRLQLEKVCLDFKHLFDTVLKSAPELTREVAQNLSVDWKVVQPAKELLSVSLNVKSDAAGRVDNTTVTTSEGLPMHAFFGTFSSLDRIWTQKARDPSNFTDLLRLTATKLLGLRSRAEWADCVKLSSMGIPWAQEYFRTQGLDFNSNQGLNFDRLNRPTTRQAILCTYLATCRRYGVFELDTAVELAKVEQPVSVAFDAEESHTKPKSGNLTRFETGSEQNKEVVDVERQRKLDIEISKMVETGFYEFSKQSHSSVRCYHLPKTKLTSSLTVCILFSNDKGEVLSKHQGTGAFFLDAFCEAVKSVCTNESCEPMLKLHNKSFSTAYLLREFCAFVLGKYLSCDPDVSVITWTLAKMDSQSEKSTVSQSAVVRALNDSPVGQSVERRRNWLFRLATEHYKQALHLFCFLAFHARDSALTDSEKVHSVLTEALNILPATESKSGFRVRTLLP